jgi:type I restriction enzyme S subunit
MVSLLRGRAMPEGLKKGWTRVAFGDVVRQVRDHVDPENTDLERYVAGEHMETDDLRIRRWGTIGDGYLGPAFHMRFKPGHVLYGSRRTYLRKVAVADFEGITANTTFVIETKDPKVLLPELLPFIMQTESFHAHSIKESKGSVNPYINFSDLTWYEFALPPLEEQRRIAEVLSALQDAAEATRESERSLYAVRRAHLGAFFEPRFRDGVPLTTVARIAAGSTPSKANPGLWGGCLPWASGKDLKTRLLANTEGALTESGWAQATVAPRGAILVVVRGMILAHTFPVARCEQDTAFNQDLRALIAKDTIEPDYLLLWTEWAAPWFLSCCAASTHGTKRIEGRVFGSALVPVPNRDEQLAFVAEHQTILDAMETLGERKVGHKVLSRSFLKKECRW